MSQSIAHYVSASVTLEGQGAQPASFSVPIFVYEHAVTANRLDGPYTNLADMVSDGFVAGSAPYLWASAVLSQQPHTASWYIGRLDAGDASVAAGMDAILAQGPGLWYAINFGSRDPDDILAMAAWTESQVKLYIAQSNDPTILSGDGPAFQNVIAGTAADGNYDLIFTGFGLAAPVTLRITRAAGAPAANADLGDAQRTELETQADTGGDLEDVVDIASIGGTGATVSFSIQDGLPAGTVTTAQPVGATQTVTVTDADIASRLFLLQYARTALVYHATDSQYLDGAWTGKGLAFDLDTQKGAWSFLRLSGVEGASLSDAQVTAMRATNCNYFADAELTAGGTIQAFTAQGWVGIGESGAGRRIDTTISLDWLQARIEEESISVLLRAAPFGGVPYTDAGINLFGSAWGGVLGKGVAAGHLMEFEVPEGEPLEGTMTPHLDLPQLSETTTAQRTSRTFSGTGLVYLRSSIEKVNIAIAARQ